MPKVEANEYIHLILGSQSVKLLLCATRTWRLRPFSERECVRICVLERERERAREEEVIFLENNGQ